MEKLYCLQSKLESWNRSHFGNVGIPLKQLKISLSNLANLPRIGANIVKEDNIRSQIAEWCCREEILWIQRSRVSLSRECNQNTKFFHKRASARRKINRINLLISQNGNIIDDQLGIEREVVSFFHSLSF